jgi:hypothetical protein
MVIIFIFLGLTKIIEPFMPTIHLRSLNAAFHAPDWRLWYLFAAGVPLLATLNLLFRGLTFVYMSSFIVGGALFGLSFSGNLRQIPETWIAPIVLVTWAVFAAYLYRVCFCKSLATQK